MRREEAAGLVSIGEFARLSRLSPKALRRYDELGLLVPARVDPESGYRWYAAGQAEQARLVAALRRIAMPSARIRRIQELDAARAAEEIRAHWAAAEAEHAAQRELAHRLVDRLHGGNPIMSEPDMSEPDMSEPGGRETGGSGAYAHEIAVRDMPGRALLTLIRRVHQDELVEVTRALFVRRLRGGGAPGLDGVAGAPFMIFHGEVSRDSDGPVEWCWPLPDEQAADVAAQHPDLTLRTEPAHREAFVRTEPPGLWGSSATSAENAVEALAAWAQQRQDRPTGGIRMLLVPNPDNGTPGPDGEFALVLR